jgi:predicted TPR repeat methyltransferase
MRRKQGKGRSKDRPAPAAAPRVAVSDMLLGHAGLGAALPDAADLAGAAAQDNLGAAMAALRRQRELADDLAAAERALAADPRSPALLLRRADLLTRLKRPAEAAATYRRCLEIDPAREDVRHLLQALEGANLPGRASDAYLRSAFDAADDRFDETLVHWLDYRGPEIALDLARAALGAGAHGLDVIDLGCGTGLNAPLFRPLARRLAGVDIAPRMIEKARARGLYDELAVAEICAHLRGSRRRWRLALATDVFNYFGALEEPLAAVYGALRPDGLLVFTVEKGAGLPAQLAATGRYRHDDSYVRGVAAAAGFRIEIAEEAVLRREGGQPVIALAYALRKPAA